MPRAKKIVVKENELLACSAILETVDEAVRFVLHAMCLASIAEGQTGDRAAKMIVERVAQRMERELKMK